MLRNFLKELKKNSERKSLLVRNFATSRLVVSRSYFSDLFFSLSTSTTILPSFIHFFLFLPSIFSFLSPFVSDTSFASFVFSFKFPILITWGAPDTEFWSPAGPDFLQTLKRVRLDRTSVTVCAVGYKVRTVHRLHTSVVR